jgi:WS/DGAT/MGAT family acyltransferase
VEGGNGGPIERIAPSDLVMLAMDRRGRTPEHLGAVLVLGAGTDVVAVERVIAERARRIPRLCQRLVRVPPGCGNPVWIDDADFDPSRQMRRVRCPHPATEQELLDLAAAIATEPLPRSRPLWISTIVTGLADERIALVIVLHHVVADGIGGLAVLDRLVDGAAVSTPARAFPSPRPALARLAAEAARARLRSLRRFPTVLRALRVSLAAGGGMHPPAAAPCSLLQPTGSRRRFAVARADLAGLRAAAHRYGGTVNDAMLAAVAGALRTVLVQRGERVETFRVGLMVAARRSAPAEALGNSTAPLLVDVPSSPEPEARLAAIAGTVRARRDSATGPAPVALIAPLFRALAALGIFRWYIAHQRRLHTLTSNVRGPDRQCRVADAPIESIIPISVGEAGNITVGFVALSYAGVLVVTVTADPDHAPDLPAVATALQDELDALVTAARAEGGERAGEAPHDDVAG